MRLPFFIPLVVLLAEPNLLAVIVDSNQLQIDFTDVAAASDKASWPKSDATITESGLGWNGKGTSSQFVWFLTEPVPLGLSWRPPTGASITGKILPGVEKAESSLEPSASLVGQLYVRYGPDCKNWTAWQALQIDESLFREKGEIVFKGLVQIPYRDREAYEELLLGYMRKDDVPWGSDEDAAVRWILSKDPTFFERTIPIIGYVQFLFENRFSGGRRVAAFSADISYGMSGRSMMPRDKPRSPDLGTPWNYKAESVPPEAKSSGTQ